MPQFYRVLTMALVLCGVLAADARGQQLLEVDGIELRGEAQLVMSTGGGNLLAQSGVIQVPEIPNPNLPDIAVVVPDPRSFYGAVIYYNPLICNQVGAWVCGFFRTHEYGHVALGHALVRTFPPIAERSADCWAAQNGSPDDTLAAYEAFLIYRRSSPDWWRYGDPIERANRLRICAIQAERWLGP